MFLYVAHVLCSYTLHTNFLKSIQVQQTEGSSTVGETCICVFCILIFRVLIHCTYCIISVQDQQIEESKAVVETLSAEVRTLKSVRVCMRERMCVCVCA